jgi:pimeloyl-ACP methyl ester carboxylesterase
MRLRSLRRVLLAVAAAAGLAATVPAYADHLETNICPAEPTREFPAAFKPPVDRQAGICQNASQQWTDDHVGGWGGGDCPASHRRRTPVILVHGNTTDAWFWRTASESGDGTIVNVRQRLLDSGYCAREVWAISYSGDASPRGAYASGYTTYNDVNAEEVYQFMRAVRDYTGAGRVDVVGHSLGVTVVRKAMFLHRNDRGANNPYRFVRHAVMIAGANHGNTGCRLGTTLHPSHVCDETDPVSPWLVELNSIGESPGPTKWMSVCECLGVDQTYEGPDIESPLLAGSVQIRLPGTPHLTLARGNAGLDKFVPFLVQGSEIVSVVKGVKTPRPSVKPAVLPSTGVADELPAGMALLALAVACALTLRRSRA